MPMKPREMEKRILAIPFHKGKGLNKRTEDSIRKQAGLM